MNIEIKIEGADPLRIAKYIEIFKVLIEKGALDGVKSGKTIIHFDNDGLFQGIQFDYWPYRRRS